MPFKKNLTFMILFFFGILGLFLLLFTNLPFILESHLQNHPPEFLNSGDLDFSIRNIGVSNIFISDVRISEDIDIDSVNIDYKIKSLRQIEIKKVTISGLTLVARLDEKNRIQIQGLSFPGTSKSENNKKNELSFPPFLPEKLDFKNCRIILKAFHEETLIPIEIFSSLRLENKKILFQADIHLFGETIVSNLTYDLEKGIEFVRLEGKSFGLDHLEPFIPKNIKEIKLNGDVDFKLESSFPQKEWNLYISKLDFINPLHMAFEEINAGIVISQHVITTGGTFKIAHPLLSANKINYDLKIDTSKGVDSEFFIHTGPVMVNSEAMAASFPEIAVSGMISISENNIPNINILIQSSKGRVHSLLYKTLASDISFEIPINYPALKDKSIGKFSLPSITYNNQFVFSTKGDILQTDTKILKITGKVLSKTLPAVQTQIDAILDFENDVKAYACFETNRFKLKYPDIKRIIPQNQTPFEMDLLTSVKGSMDYTNHQLKTRMQMNVTDSSISLPELDLKAKGINTRIDFNDLLIPETIPGQVLTIRSIDIKKIRISEAKIQFSLEDAKSLLVENIRFKWCNGLISTEALRFPQEKNEYHLTLFCDRLELTELLKQMGVFHAEGDGTLNGRIPIIYSDGKISFNNGFLFSTPGSKGKVIIENTDRIIAGIPMDSPEFSQLDVAREALKNFNYEWAKLTLNTQGDTLTINMELDGKPAGLLPFEYKKELGGFVRVDASSPGSNFQGIKLDVNLKLPFNDVMKFGNQLNTLLNE
ncbi:MAG: YdbH domain-containing protein [Desulfobacula sp.]|jgi:hypothetical protein